MLKSDSKVKQWFEDLLKELKELLDKAYIALKCEKSWEQMELIKNDKQAVDLIAEFYFKGMEGAKGRAANADTSGKQNIVYSQKDGDAAQYDYSKPFEEQLEDWEAGKIAKNDTLIVSPTPKVFQKIGFNALPVTINQTHIDYAINGTKDFDHALGKNGLKQLPEALEHPIAIISSKTQNTTSVVAMLEIRQSGKQVIVPVTVDGFGKVNLMRIDSNAASSI